MIVWSTPIVQYRAHSHSGIIGVKRDDLAGIPPMPPFSKCRGMVLAAEGAVSSGAKSLGTVITYASYRGTALAAWCLDNNIPCFIFYGKYKHEDILPVTLDSVLDLGVDVIPVPAGRYGVMVGRARKLMPRGGIVLSHGNTDRFMVESQYIEASLTIASYPKYRIGSWVFPTATGLSAAGAIKAIVDLGLDIQPILYLVGDSKVDKVLNLIVKYSGVDKMRLKPIRHSQNLDEPMLCDVPFPCNIYYDTKAWEYVCDSYNELHKPVLFWNAGA